MRLTARDISALPLDHPWRTKLAEPRPANVTLARAQVETADQSSRPVPKRRAARGTGAVSRAKRAALDLTPHCESIEYLLSLEGRWLTRWRARGGSEPVKQHTFSPPRRWRFDFAWPDCKVAVEVNGGTWTGGGHSRGKGQRSDAEKNNAAAALGWVVLVFTTDMVQDDTGFDAVLTTLDGRQGDAVR